MATGLKAPTSRSLMAYEARTVPLPEITDSDVQTHRARRFHDGTQNAGRQPPVSELSGECRRSLHRPVDPVEEGAILFSELTISAPAACKRTTTILLPGQSARITKDDWLQIMDGRWPEVELSAESLTTAGIRMDGPYLKLWHEQNQSVGFPVRPRACWAELNSTASLICMRVAAGWMRRKCQY